MPESNNLNADLEPNESAVNEDTRAPETEELHPDAAARLEGAPSRFSRRKKFGALLIVVVLAGLVGWVFIGNSAPRKTKVAVNAQSQAGQQKQQDATQTSADQAIAALTQEARAAAATNNPGATVAGLNPSGGTEHDPSIPNSVGVYGVNPQPNDPVFNPGQQNGDYSQHTGNYAGTGGGNPSAERSSINARRGDGNPPNLNGDDAPQSGAGAQISARVKDGKSAQESWYFEAKPSVPTAIRPIAPGGEFNERLNAGWQLGSQLTAGIVKPPFGTLLPVRTLGALYTLRSGGLMRFELTRPVSGDGWQLPRATVLLGRVVGGQNDRAFVSLIGFLDPRGNQLVALGGELMGGDGGQGLKGTRQRVGSRWGRALKQVTGAGVNLATSYLLGRNSSGTGGYGYYQISPDSALPLEGVNNANQEFVAVAAGSEGFFMVNELPPAIDGVAAPGSGRVAADTGLSSVVTGELTEQEVVELMTTGDEGKIRAALPRMNARLRAVAQQVLRDGER